MSSPRLNRPVEEIRVELLSDAHTAKIAQCLDMSPEEYVDLVLDYAQHPEKQPEFNILPEGEATNQGAATVNQVKQWFTDLQEGKVDLRSPYEKDAFETPAER